MAVTHQEFLRSAAQLVDGVSEIDFRNATSRAHYAAYHACQTVACYCPEVKSEGMGHHEALVSRFQKYPKEKPGYKTAQKIAWLLNQTRLARADADYEIGRVLKQGFAKTQVGNSKRIIDLVVELSIVESVKDTV